MEKTKEIKLSILVITHNQYALLPRCIDSLLKQKMDFNYEIIIGDDRSTDGTWELVKSYEKQNPNLIIGYQINSDDCNPTVLSERSGYNRTIAYSKSRGKYFAEVDGDDYLIGKDVYQKQVELLDAHPECSLCMQNLISLNDGDSIENGKLWFEQFKFHNGQIISAADYIQKYLFIQHQAFVYRKNLNVDPVSILGKHYEDTTITLHQLQFGSIIFLDRHDYVCVRYKESINSSLIGDDRDVAFSLLPLRHIFYIPTFSGLFFKAGLSELIHITKQLSEMKLQISKGTRCFFSQFDGFIYDYLQKVELSVYDRIRLLLIRILLVSMKRSSIVSTFIFRITYSLITNYKEMSRIPKEFWHIN